MTLYSSYKDFRKDSSLLKMAYLKRPIDYLWSLLIVIGVIITIISLSYIELPKFMTWSLVSLLSDNKTSGNIIVAPFSSGSLIIVIGFWFLLSLALPYLAKSEEKSFRSLVFGTKNRIITSIKFGLIDMIVGVPLIIALVLSVIGYIYSIFYVTAFNKAIKVNPNTADEVALNVSTSVHSKYNFILITLGAILTILSITLK